MAGTFCDACLNLGHPFVCKFKKLYTNLPEIYIAKCANCSYCTESFEIIFRLIVKFPTLVLSFEHNNNNILIIFLVLEVQYSIYQAAPCLPCYCVLLNLLVLPCRTGTVFLVTTKSVNGARKARVRGFP